MERDDFLFPLSSPHRGASLFGREGATALLGEEKRSKEGKVWRKVVWGVRTCEVVVGQRHTGAFQDRKGGGGGGWVGGGVGGWV